MIPLRLLRPVTLPPPLIGVRPLPDGFKIRFVDNGGHDLTIVLPDPLPTTASEIHDEELARVAGALPTSNCGIYTQACTFNACSPLYTKKPNSPTLCPH